MKIFELTRGSLPILISMPHNGTQIPQNIASSMTTSAIQVVDTDWYLDRLYQFALEMGCSVINPVYSRYVIDLNRPKTNESLYPGADTTELCPTSQFDQQPIYLTGREPDNSEIQSRVDHYWQPYHQQLSDSLSEIRNHFGYVLLFEAHSIKSVVPRFFEGQLADFNFGNFDRKSSSPALSELIEQWASGTYSKVFNGRFKGGYITRHYGCPAKGIDSLQLELSQATYLNEDTLEYSVEKANQVICKLKNLFDSLTQFALKQSAAQ